MKGERIYKVKGLLLLCFLSILNFQFSTVSAQELLDYPLDTVNGEEVYRYAVDKGIGLYRVGVNFNVSQADIIRLNPQLNERGLHYKEILLIPTGRPIKPEPLRPAPKDILPTEEVKEEPAPVVEEPAPAPVVEEEPVAVAEEPVTVVEEVVPAPVVEEDVPAPTPVVEPFTGETVELALMLPFESQQAKRSTNGERMMEFYQGALLALKDLQNDQTHYRLRVFDTERSERRVNSLCDGNDLEHVRGIIGPVYPIQIERVASWAAQHKVPVILPFSADDDLAQKPYLLQFNSTDRQQADSLRVWIENHDVNCVIVEVKEADMSASARMIRKQIKDHHIPHMTVTLRDLMNDSIAYVMDPLRENLILLHSDKYQHVRILLPHIAKLQADGFRIRIVSQYSWLKENIDLPQVCASMFTAEGSREAYDAHWTTYFNTEHSSDSPRYDLLGYDLMRAMVAWLQGEQDYKGLQSDIRWMQDNNGGFQNECVRVIAY